jgi:hypothetical protein
MGSERWRDLFQFLVGGKVVSEAKPSFGGVQSPLKIQWKTQIHWDDLDEKSTKCKQGLKLQGHRADLRMSV